MTQELAALNEKIQLLEREKQEVASRASQNEDSFKQSLYTEKSKLSEKVQKLKAANVESNNRF